MDVATSVLAVERTAGDWLLAGIVFAAAIVVGVIIQMILTRVMRRTRVRRDVVRVMGRILAIVIVTAGFFYSLSILEVAIGPLLGALGFGGIVIAFALQGILANFVGGMLLQARRPFRPGDQIESNGFTGTVLEVNSRTVRLLSYDGTHLHIPNTEVLEHVIHNFTAEEFRRTQIPVLVGYDTDLRATTRLLGRTLAELDGVCDVPPADCIVTGMGDNGIELMLRVWHPSEELETRAVVSNVVITALETLRGAGVTIPYPQRVLHWAGNPPSDGDDDDRPAKPQT